jgi:uncharacterized repeat protein (TIGR01451 family)
MAIVSAGDSMTYTIRISNVGHKDVAENMLTVRDVLDDLVTYVPGTTKVSASAGSTTFNKVDDSTSGTAFPLDDAGYVIPAFLPKRGGTIDVTFQVKVASSFNKPKILNQGTVTQIGAGVMPFETTTLVNFGALVSISNTVYRGSDQGSKCGTASAVETVSDFMGSSVTYCYNVTNTGKCHLGAFTISAKELNYTRGLNEILAPGMWKLIAVDQKIGVAVINNAVVVGAPVFSNGTLIPDVKNVTATDPSSVGVLTIKASINITNTVYLGADNGNQCNTNIPQEKVTDIHGSKVVYCFTISNTGTLKY